MKVEKNIVIDRMIAVVAPSSYHSANPAVSGKPATSNGRFWRSCVEVMLKDSDVLVL